MLRRVGVVKFHDDHSVFNKLEWISLTLRLKAPATIGFDSVLTLRENHRRCVNQERQAEARSYRLINEYGVPPVGAKPRDADRSGHPPYAAGLTWDGSVGMEGEYQESVNRMRLPVYTGRSSGSREKAHPGRIAPRLPIGPISLATAG